MKRKRGGKVEKKKWKRSGKEEKKKRKEREVK